MHSRITKIPPPCFFIGNGRKLSSDELPYDMQPMFGLCVNLHDSVIQRDALSDEELLADWPYLNCGVTVAPARFDMTQSVLRPTYIAGPLRCSRTLQSFTFSLASQSVCDFAICAIAERLYDYTIIIAQIV